jgi:hypothetical protein
VVNDLQGQDAEVIWDDGPWFYRAWRYGAPIEVREATLWMTIASAAADVDNERSAPYVLGYDGVDLLQDDEPQFGNLFGFWDFLRAVAAETDAFEEME